MADQRSGQLSIIPSTAVFDERISNAELRVLSVLGAHTNRQGYCWPATTSIAKDLGISTRQVRKCLRRLEHFSYLETDPKPGQRSTYRVVRELSNPGSSGSGVTDLDPGSSGSAPPEAQVPGTPEAQVPPNGTKNGTKNGKRAPSTSSTKNSYAFTGKIVRLTQTDFDQWEKSFRHIDLRGALQSRDDWLAELPENDRRRSSSGWYRPTSNWLASRNEQAATQVRHDDAESDTIY